MALVQVGFHLWVFRADLPRHGDNVFIGARHRRGAQSRVPTILPMATTAVRGRCGVLGVDTGALKGAALRLCLFRA